jgi:hypothetical protein
MRPVRPQGIVHVGDLGHQGSGVRNVPEEHPVARDAQEEDPGRFMARLPGKGGAEGVDSPGEDRMPRRTPSATIRMAYRKGAWKSKKKTGELRTPRFPGVR